MDCKVIVYIAMSLDGYIAREDGGLDWLFKHASTNPEEYGYHDFYRTIDTVIMGKATYDELPRLTETFPYADKTCYVFSRKTSGRDEHVSFVNEPVAPFIKRLKKQTAGHIWLVGGGKLIEAFRQADVIDLYIVAVVPVIIGKGIPLFTPTKVETPLSLTDHFRFGDSMMLYYDVKR